MRKIDVACALALTLGVAMAAGEATRPAQARTAAEMELRSLPITPQEPADPRQQDRLINELYSHYVDCLEASGGSEELCYRRWWRECRSMFPGNECPLLEEKMFPTPPNGDESC